MQSTRHTMFKLTVCTVAAAASLAAGSAAAQSVTLYGQVDTFAGVRKNFNEKSRGVVDFGGMQTSHFGMKGKEELGNGLKAVFNINGFFRPDTGQSGRFNGDAMFTRDAYVGLESANLGTLLLGRNTAPYFISTILFNALTDSYTFSPAVMHTYLGQPYALGGGAGSINAGVIGDSGWDNAILYTTPNFGGLTASAIYSFGEQAGKTGENKFGGNVLYFNGNFAATLAVQRVKFDITPVGDPFVPVGFRKQDAATAGASYDFKVAKLFAQGQYIKSDVANLDIKTRGGMLGASVPVGAGKVLVSYAYGKTTGGAADETRNSFGVGYDYFLSKRTDVYAAYYYDKLKSTSNAYTAGVGIRHNF